VGLQKAAPIVPELGSFVLLNYFMAIEVISDEVTRALRGAMEAQLKEELMKSVAKLREELAEETRDEKGVEIIRKAARRLSRIQFSYADLKVERAGQELRHDQAVIDEAKDLSQFRNQYLGHPRSQIPEAHMSHWFEGDLAFSLSNAYLRAYIAK
jgi:hypothetical protein